MTTKTCCICKNEKPLSSFEPRRDRPGQLRSQCRPCKSAAANASKKRTGYKWKRPPEQRRLYRLKTIFGLTEQAHTELYNEQFGRCAICGTHEKDTAGKRLRVDHCHKTGHIRGLLCLHCNSGIGMFRDSGDTLKKAIKYLGG